MGLCTDFAIYTIKVNGNGVINAAGPSGGCSSVSSTQSFYVGAGETVTRFEAWRNNVNFKVYKAVLTLNTGAQQSYD